MKHPALILGGILALCGCSYSMGGGSIRQSSHQNSPAAGLRSLHVENVSGSITVSASRGAMASVDWTKRSSTHSGISNTHVIVSRDGSALDVRTHYAKNGFFNHNGASVDYRIAVPAGVSVNLTNVSGPVTLRGLTKNIEVQEVSGQVAADLGRVAGSRDVTINSVSGGIDLNLARNSDVTVNAKTLSGKISSFFSTSASKGFVGASMQGHLGNGSASMNLNSISGSVILKPQ